MSSVMSPKKLQYLERNCNIWKEIAGRLQAVGSKSKAFGSFLKGTGRDAPKAGFNLV